MIPFLILLVRVMRLANDLQAATYPAVAPLFIFGTFGRPLSGLFCRVVKLGHRVGARLHPLRMVLGATCVRLEIFPCGHRMAAVLDISRKVLWLLATTDIDTFLVVVRAVRAVTTLLVLKFLSLRRIMFTVCSILWTRLIRLWKFLGESSWAVPHLLQVLAWKACCEMLKVMVMRAGCLLCNVPTSTEAKLQMVPASRLASASKPLIGSVQNVWQVSERLLSRRSCLLVLVLGIC